MQEEKSLAETGKHSLHQSETQPAADTVQRASGSSILSYFIPSIVAVVLAWGIIQSLHPVFVVDKKYNIAMGAPPEAIEALRVQQLRAARLNSMLEVALLGGLLAGAMAFGRPACCPTLMRLPVAIPWGALIGAGAGQLASLVLAARNAATLPDVSDTIKVQALLFGLLGAGLGLMVGLFAGSIRTGITGAIAGTITGVVAGIVYPMAAAILMPTVTVEPVVPYGAAIRLLWAGLFAVSIALVLPRTVQPAVNPKR
jgi:hypothetical protein